MTHDLVLSHVFPDADTNNHVIPSADNMVQNARKSSKDVANKIHMNMCRLQLEICPTYEQKFSEHCSGMDISEGIFVHGTLEDMTVNFLVDTGASVSVLSLKTLEKLPVMQRPEIERSSVILKMGNGAEVPVYGTVVLPVILGQTQFTETFMVASIEEEGVYPSCIKQVSN